MKHYAGSIAFDNEVGEWEDHIIKADDLDELAREMKLFMKRRKNSEVFFACLVNKSGKELDLTNKIKELIYG
tara:strand:+ start:45 stop:260 length:216 start_codon:yes stop_codon:yes gene_type:complete